MSHQRHSEENERPHSSDEGRTLGLTEFGAATRSATGLRPGERWGRYEVEELLGAGGMGEVWRARDPELDRPVALKVLLHPAPGMVQRFLREARLQAGMGHPNICQVHEVGEVDARPYIAMQLIRGRALHTLRGELTVEQTVQIVRDVAQALHAAHRIGLVHRDVKPSNILVEEGDDGHWRPCVVDFGLAREVTSSDLTHTGEILGTPGFLSPEQALGEPVDRRTDVYCLGATLYALLTGRPPFEGSLSQALVEVIGSEPAPPRTRNRAIPADLQDIMLKCLEKDPDRRYSSARALAEDLQRFIDGEPIQARHVGPLYRLTRWVRRHRVATLAAAVAVVLVSVLVLMLLGARRQTRLQAAAAQDFGREVERIEGRIRLAHAVPLHDLRHELAELGERLHGIEQAMARRGDAARGPGLYALGRGALALGDDERAVQLLETAWTEGYRSPDVSLALGMALGRVYQRELEALRRIPSAGLRAERRRELETTLRDRATRHLRAAATSRDLPVEYVEGLLALHEQRFDDALELAETARGEHPWFHEAGVLAATASTEIGNRLRDRGQVEAARQAFDRAQQQLQWASEVGESDPEVWEGLCSLHKERLFLAMNYSGGDAEPEAAAAQEACDRAATAHPGRAEPHILKSVVFTMLARQRGRSGKDPEAAFAGARQEAEVAIRLDPDEPELYNNLGILLDLEASWEGYRGRDPQPLWSEAAARLATALELEPRNAAALNNAGLVHSNWGRWLFDRGRDPADHFDQAAALYRRAIEVHPQLAAAHSNLCMVHKNRAAVLDSRGEAATPALDAAEAACREAIRLNPEKSDAHTALGNVHGRRAAVLEAVGEDPRDEYRLAIQAHTRAAELNPHQQIPWINLGIFNRDLAAAQLEHGGDVDPALEAARTAFARVEELGELTALDLVDEAGVELVEARRTIAQGRDPSPALARARQMLERAMRLDPQTPAIDLSRGRIELLTARWRASEGQDTSLALARAVELFQRAADATPTDAVAWELLAEARLVELERLPSHSPDLETVREAGLDSCRRAQRANPRRVRARELEASLQRQPS